MLSVLLWTAKNYDNRGHFGRESKAVDMRRTVFPETNKKAVVHKGEVVGWLLVT
jgi:hypothetical protein